MIDALGSAGNLASQTALVDLMPVPAAEPFRGRIVTALSQADTPSERSIAALKAVLVAAPFNTQALYTLGTFASPLADRGDTARAQTLRLFW